MSEIKYYWNVEMIKDLIDPTDKVRNTGRSTALAEAWIALAKENPNTKIKFFDHYRPTDRESVRYIAVKIAEKINLLNSTTKDRLTFKIINEDTLVYAYIDRIPLLKDNK